MIRMTIIDTVNENINLIAISFFIGYYVVTKFKINFLYPFTLGWILYDIVGFYIELSYYYIMLYSVVFGFVFYFLKNRIKHYSKELT